MHNQEKSIREFTLNLVLVISLLILTKFLISVWSVLKTLPILTFNSIGSCVKGFKLILTSPN
ncbi:hypothetical protein GvMRE_IIg430 [endosymbiont GvMRE of Glomus versiforme]|nr:hypothetical protein GvMRE_IIg430 [endosymbiont GvMRE of Glomus versiforme]